MNYQKADQADPINKGVEVAGTLLGRALCYFSSGVYGSFGSKG